MSIFQCIKSKFQRSCKKRCFLILNLACLDVHGEVRDFGTVSCRIHFWLRYCKNYRNRLRFEKVNENVTATFCGPQLVYLHHVCEHQVFRCRRFISASLPLHIRRA